MTKPIALLIGSIFYAQNEWSDLSKYAILENLTGGERSEIIENFKSGKYNGVVAIFRTYESAEFTGNFDKELIDSLPDSVKFICHNGAGYDQIDVSAATARQIQVSHTPGAVSNATANVAMKLMLLALRRAWKPQYSLRQGKWRGENMELGHDPEGKTVGIVGMGGIGKAFAKKLMGFDVNIIYYNEFPKIVTDLPAGVNATPVTMDELIEKSDIISLHVPLLPSTRHLLSKDQFNKMKDGVVIINTSRGPVIDEQALADALESGKVYSAGLDVFENEPKINSELFKNDNVIMFPHIGTWTHETQYKMELLVVKNVESALRFDKLLTRVPEQRTMSKF